MASNFKDENKINYKSISCENIPELFLDKMVARNHFSKFGKISKFILRPSRLQCTIDFEQEDDAKAALLNGTIFNGYEFIIKYTENEVPQVRNTEEWVDPDIQSELDAMGNVSQKQYRNSYYAPVYHTKPQQPMYRAPKPLLKSKPVNSIQQMAPAEPTNIQQETKNNEIRSQNTLKNELENLMKKPATTITEKCNILDARDKYLRLIRTKTTDIKKVVSTKGTCPDMCPEKERLLREIRDQVACFELNGDGNTMNHKMAVKEYSRSSADQEAPLAHELRPEPVLKMTMTYLLHRVMDLCDDEDLNVGEWFHFVWDRTRSIRKDITQQELCSVVVVELVEQCARFHIHCAARLVAEEPSVFDQKINTENLTKCLQSLKYMYHDLRIKNIKCANESEFRAYIVLLNLNDANFLWEIKQLPEEIVKSKQIKEAIEFFLAVENNNFIKFFKLIRKTTYMNSCILMRYFNQVRSSAVRIIIKAYTSSRQNTIQMPLNYLAEILAFESTNDAVTFFEHYGIESEYGRVILEKNWNFIPDVPLQLDRYLKVIERKRSVSVGESVCGKPLISESIFENHQPHNSFDKNGYLKLNAWRAEDQNGDGSLNNTKSIRPTPDNVFKIPQNSPPISSKQQQQQQIKSLFGLASQKTNAGSFLDEIDNENISKTAKSIFASNKLSPTSVPSSIFGSAKVTHLEKDTVPSSVFSNSKTQSANIFKQQQSEDWILRDEENNQTGQFPISSSDSIFSKSTKPTTSIFSGTETIENNSVFGKQPHFSIFDTPKTESNSAFYNDDPINTFSFGVASSDLKISSSYNQKSNLFSDSEQNNKSFNIESTKQPPYADNLFKLPSVDLTDTKFSNNVNNNKSIFQGLDESKSDSSFINKQNNSKRKSVSDEIDIFPHSPYENKEIQSYTQQFNSKEEKFNERNVLEDKNLKDLEKNQKVLENENLMKEQQNKIKVIRMALIEKKSQQIVSEICEEVQSNIIKTIVNETLLTIKRNQTIDLNAKNILQNLCNELVSENLREIVQFELNRFFKNQNILKKYFEKWRASTIKSEERKHLIQKAQNWAIPESIDVIAKQMAHPKQSLNLEMIHRYRLGIPKTFDVPSENTVEKINVFSILSKELNDSNTQFKIYGRMKSKKYLKFVISLPDSNNEIKNFNSYLNNFLDESIERQTSRDQDAEFMCENDSNFAVCIQKICGEPNLKTISKCYHLNGLIFFFTLVDLSSTKRRLFHLLNNSKIHKSIPLSLLLYKTSYDNCGYQIEDILALDELQRLGKISTFEIFEINEHILYNGLTDAISFLGKHFSYDNDLEMQTFVSFLQATIAGEIWKRFYDSWLINPSFQFYCTKPENVIRLYNSAISKLIDLFKEDFSKHVQFPSELVKFVPSLFEDVPKEIEYFPNDWKNEQRYSKIIKFLQKLRLKDIERKWPTNIKELEMAILNYCDNSISNSKQSIQVGGYSAIKVLLEKLNNSEFIDIPITVRLEKISWLEIIRPITLELLSQVWKTDQNLIPNEVIYKKKKYAEYLNLPWWLGELKLQELKINSKIEVKLKLNSNLPNNNFEIIDDNNDNHEDLETILNKGNQLVNRTTENIEKFRNYLKSSRKISKELDMSLYDIESKKIKLSTNFGRNFVMNHKNYSPPKNKKLQNETCTSSTNEVEDVITKALSVIKKVELRMDIRKKHN